MKDKESELSPSLSLSRCGGFSLVMFALLPCIRLFVFSLREDNPVESVIWRGLAKWYLMP